MNGVHLTFADLRSAHPSGSKLHPQPFSLGRREPEFKVLLLKERDLGFDVSAQPNSEGGSGGRKTGMHPMNGSTYHAITKFAFATKGCVFSKHFFKHFFKQYRSLPDLQFVRSPIALVLFHLDSEMFPTTEVTKDTFITYLLPYHDIVVSKLVFKSSHAC